MIVLCCCMILFGLLLLDAVIAKMPYRVVVLLDVVVGATDSEIGFLVDINLQGLDGGYQNPLSNVEFAEV